MTIFYAICAVVGGTVFVLQFLLGFVGVDGDQDFDADPNHAHHGLDSSLFFGVLTFKTMVAAMTFFGLAGLAAGAADMQPAATFIVALAAGLAAMFVVALIMRGLIALQHEGTQRVENTIGKPGTVYLSIPGNKTGFGKVTVNFQNRSAEYTAVTFQDTLPTGSKVVVVDIVGPDTVEVIAAPEVGPVASGPAAGSPQQQVGDAHPAGSEP